MLQTKNKIKTIIVDDEPLSRIRIRNLLSEYPVFVLSGEAATGDEALELMNEIHPDCVFLDISLPGFDGFTLLEKLDVDKEPLIVVVSGSEEHALKAFDYYAFDYLLKPYRDKRFEKTLSKIIAHFENEPVNNGHFTNPSNIRSGNIADKNAGYNNNLIPVKNAGKIQFIETNDIHFVEASGYYIEVNLQDKKHLLRQSMGQITDRLDPEKFIRIHRSVIVNLNFMKEIVRSVNKEYAIKMKSGKTFKVSKSYKRELFEKLNL